MVICSTPSEAEEGRELDEPEETELALMLREQVNQLKTELDLQKAMMEDMCKLSCEQLLEMDSTFSKKDDEIDRLNEELT